LFRAGYPDAILKGRRLLLLLFFLIEPLSLIQLFSVELEPSRSAEEGVGIIRIFSRDIFKILRVILGSVFLIHAYTQDYYYTGGQ
jgi:hypothetical protein